MAPTNIVVLGDSVVWGEYVLPDGTLSHFLNQEAGATNRFVNAGVNGLFPLALEGLVRYYGRPLRHQKVILHCNVLWMTSPKADLSTDKEEPFNHAALVPQFFPRIPCYRADANERLSAIVERNVPFLEWVSHLQNAYFGQKSIPKWTLAEDGRRSAALSERLPQSVFPNHADRSRGAGRRSAARPAKSAPQALVHERQRHDAVRMGRARPIAPMARLPAGGRNPARARQRRAGRVGAVQRTHDGRGEPPRLPENPR